MKDFWENNQWFLTCKKLAERMDEIDFSENVDQSLSQLDEIFSRYDLGSVRTAHSQLEAYIEEMIEFEPHPLVLDLQINHPEAVVFLDGLLDRDTKETELRLEHQAKLQLKEVTGLIERIVLLQRELKKLIPSLRKACKPGLLGLFLSKFGGQAGTFAVHKVADKVSHPFLEMALRIGADAVEPLISSIANDLQGGRAERAIDGYYDLASGFADVCSHFSKETKQRFDPIFREYMAVEKKYEDRVMALIEELQRTSLPLRSVYRRIYGVLRD